MMDLERFNLFIEAMDPGKDELLDQLRAQAEKEHFPIIRRDTERFLRFLLTSLQPKKILEVGTGIGYSSIFMALSLAAGVSVDTIENDPDNAAAARDHFAQYGVEGKIRLLEDDAAKALCGLAETYDFIFLDGPKGQYPDYLPQLMRLLADGGVLAADNILQEGDILKSRFAVERRQRTIHARMRSFLETVMRDDRLTTTLIPVGDGLSVSVRDRKPDRVGAGK